MTNWCVGAYMCEDRKRKRFQIGDIIVESLDNTQIGKYIITSIKKERKNLDYSLYVLWTDGHWPENQGSIFVITNLHNLANHRDKEGQPYTWKKLDS